jgi:hypothetical protein
MASPAARRTWKYDWTVSCSATSHVSGLNQSRPTKYLRGFVIDSFGSSTNSSPTAGSEGAELADRKRTNSGNSGLA